METPRQAIEDTLRLLAERVDDLGFAVKSGLKIARQCGDLIEEIQAQPDRSNRADVVVRVRFNAHLKSQAVKRWIKAQTHPALAPTGPINGSVSTLQLHFAEGIAGRDFDVVQAEDRPFVADTIAASIRGVVSDWFALTGDPLTALDRMGMPIDEGGPVNEVWILRLALAHGHDAEARDALARRCLRWPEFGAAFAQYVARIRADGPPPGYRDTAEELADFAVATGIAP